MAVSFVNAGAKASAASGGITLGAPSSPAFGDTWIAVIHSSDQVAHTLTDWTQIFQANGQGTTSRLSVWLFAYAGSNPNLVVGHTSGATIVGGIAAFRGAWGSSSVIDVASQATPGSDASIEVTGLTPTYANSMLVICDGAADDNNRSTLPTGFTAAFEDSAGGTQSSYQETAGTPDGSVACHYKTHTSGATGDFVDTQAAADPWCSIMIAIPPALAITPTVGSATLTGVAPSPVQGTLRTPSVGSLTVTPIAPVIPILVPGAGSLTLTGQYPYWPRRYPAWQQYQAVTQSLIWTVGYTAVPVADTSSPSITPSVGSVTLSGSSLVLDLAMAPAVGAVAVTGETGSPVLGTLLTPSVGSVTVSGIAPGLVLGTITTPSVGSVVFAGSGLLLDLALPGTAGAISVSGSAPSLVAGTVTTPDSGTAVFSGSSSLLDFTVAPVAGSLVLTGAVPSIETSSSEPVEVTPNVGALLFSSDASAIVVGTVLTVTAGSIAVTGAAPGLITGTILAAGVGAITVSGDAPDLQFETFLSPDAGSITIQGYAPDVAADVSLEKTPDAGELALSGNAPGLINSTRTEAVVVGGTTRRRRKTVYVVLDKPATLLPENTTTRPGTAMLMASGAGPIMEVRRTRKAREQELLMLLAA